MKVNRLLYIVVIFLLLSCSREKPADTAKQSFLDKEKPRISETSRLSSSISGSYSLEITPANATRNSTLQLRAKGFNLNDAKIEWMVNGVPSISSEPEQFITLNIVKGDTVQVRAIIQDKEILSDIITIKNAPPEISKVKILPEIFKSGDTLSVDVSGSDIDEDEVIFLYEWTKNGEFAGSNTQIAIPIKRGDKISIRITPFDGEDHGKPITLHREIQNIPPMIIEHKQFNFDGKIYTYQVKAIDHDEDPLTYSLKSAPEGVNIDEKTGLVKWKVPPDFKGKVPLTVSVSDGNRGEATQQITFIIDTVPSS